MKNREVEQRIAGAKYHFAKTMSKYPHAYTRRREWADPRSFDEAVRYINANGYTEYFFRNPFIMYNIGKYKYWVTEENELINRTEIENVYSSRKA